jgi:phosphomannomutase
VVEALAEVETARGSVVDRLDGVTVDHGDWWYNVRPSNTEPLLRLNVEARDEQSCDRHVHEVLDLVRAVAG